MEQEIIDAEGVKKINKFKQSDYDNKNFGKGDNLRSTLKQ
jgi:hypothetical protein